jgi:serine/threonine protein kinase
MGGWQTCKHPTVVEYMESLMHDNSLFIVMELMDGGSLTNLIQVTRPLHGPPASWPAHFMTRPLHDPPASWPARFMTRPLHDPHAS